MAADSAHLLEILGTTLPRRGPGWWPISQLGWFRDSARTRRVLWLWIVATLLCVAGGIANVAWSWNGVEWSMFGVHVAVTIYPPFLLSVLLALWLGPTWGGIPIYLANLASAL